jgi:hypothetical protein
MRTAAEGPARLVTPRGRRMAQAIVLGAAFWPAGEAFAQATVDTMTCAAAQRFVQQNGSYNKKTGFGVLPIRPVRPNLPGQASNCGPRQYPSFFVERTLDNPSCNVGFVCQTRDIR